MKDLFVITHTRSIHHEQHLVGGWYDTALTESGIRDAQLIAGHLVSLIGQRQVEIWSSDLRRAAMTAAAIAERFETPVIELTALREISYGVAGGQPQEWLDARYVPAPDDNRLDHHCGIDGAETRRDVATRVFPCIDEIVARPCATQIIVTHGFTLTMVIAAWMKIPVEAAGFLSFPARSGSITHLRQDDFFRSRSVLKLADISHLDGGQE